MKKLFLLLASFTVLLLTSCSPTQAVVKFETNGGNSIKDVIATKNTKIILPTPSRDDNFFKGWYLDSSFKGEKLNVSYLVLDDIVLYAKWDIGIKVDFNTNNLISVNSIRGLLNQTKDLPNIDLAGYRFDGWFDNKEFNNTKLDSSYVLKQNITLYAKLTKIHNVTFTDNVETQIVDNNMYALKPNDIIKTGYLFDGWYLDNELFDFENTKITKDISLTSKFIKTYNVKLFNTENNSTISDTNYRENATINLTTPTRDGYTFLGWYDNSQFTGLKYTSTYKVIKDVTLYTKWEKIEIPKLNVVFDSQGGNEINTQVLNESQNIDLPTPSRQGYKFLGWYNSLDENAVIQQTPLNITKSITLYAKWVEEFVVEFTTNSNQVIQSVTVTKNKSINIETPATKKNHKFLGWYTTDTFEDSSKVSQVGYIVNKSITLYAKWVEVVEITLMNKDVVVQTLTSNVGDTISLPTLENNGKYTFMGWFTDETFSYRVSDNSFLVTKNQTLYAKFTNTNATLVTIQLDPMGGDNLYFVQGQNVLNAFEDEEISLPVAYKAGYEFGGWYDNNKFTGNRLTNPYTVPSTFTTLYARWIESSKTFTITYHTDSPNTIPPETVEYGYHLRNIASISKDGMILEGWYLDSALGIKIPESIVSYNGKYDLHITQNTDLYAKWMDSENALMYTKNEDDTYSVGFNPTYKYDNISKITVPQTKNGKLVTKILDFGFAQAPKIESIVLPNSITEIGNGAFASMQMLKSITFPSNLISIGSGAFSGSPITGELVIPNTVTNIADSAFNGTHFTKITFPENLTTLPNGVCGYCFFLTSVILPKNIITLGEKAFYNTKLTKITIPETLQNLGDNSLGNINNIVVDPNNNYFTAIDNVLYDKNVTKIILYPKTRTNTSYTLPSTVTEIFDNTFDGHRYLEEFIGHENLLKIGNSAFYYANKIHTIKNIDNVVSIGDSAFSSMGSLTNIQIPKKLTKISSNLFFGTPNATNLVIPNGVLTIGTYAFRDNGTKFFDVPNTVTSIDDAAFGSSVLVAVNIPSTVTTLNRIFNNTNPNSSIPTMYTDASSKMPTWRSDFTQIYIVKSTKANVVYNRKTDITYTFNAGSNISINPITSKGAILLPTLVLENHTFDGWYLDQAFTSQKLDSVYIADSNTTLYAKFTLNN